MRGKANLAACRTAARSLAYVIALAIGSAPLPLCAQGAGGAAPETAPAQPSTPGASPSAKPATAYTEAEIRALIDSGRYAAAEPIVQARRSAHAAAGTQATAEAASDTELLANILALTGRTGEAETLMREALATRERLGDPGSTARALRRLAIVLAQRQDYAGAEPLARRAIALAAPLVGNARELTAPLVGEARNLAAAWGTLGESLSGQGRRSEALIAHQKGLAIARTILSDTDPFVIEQNNDIALTLEEMGRLEEAEAIYRQGLATIVGARGKNHLDTARSLALLGTNLDRQRKYGEAEASLREAIAIREHRLGANNPDTIRSRSNLVGVLTRQSKFDEAAQVQESVRAARAGLPDRTPADEVMDLGQMAQIARKQGRLAEAVAFQRRAVALAGDQLDPGHPFVAIATIELAHALMRQNQKNPEYVDLMRGAVAVTRRERARGLLVRGAAGMSQGERALAQALGEQGSPDKSAADVYRNALSFNANYATQVPREEARMRAESFQIAQDLAATASGRALAGIALREALGDTPRARLVRRQQDLAAQVRSRNQALVDALGVSSVAATKIRAEIEALGPALADADAALQRAYPDYAELVAPAALSEKDVRRRLGKDEGLLLIVEGSLFTFSFAVTSAGANWTAVPTAFGEARTTIAAMRCDVDEKTCPPGMVPSPVFDGVTAHEIYRHLIAPHETTLKNVKTLYVTTSGELSNLPFTALLTVAPKGPIDESALATLPWLGDRFALVSLPSVAVLHTKRRDGAKPGALPFIGYGAPLLAAAGGKRDVDPGLAPAAEGPQPGLADPARLRKLVSLPGTEVELRAMAAVLGAGSDAIRLGAAATEPAVRSDARIRNARIVAFATHGLLPAELDGRNEPGLVFTPPDRASAADDGVLAASEVAALDLSADWVILSACNTATPDDRGGGDALSALGRAFLHAGAGSLLASYWRVGDDVTAALTVETLANARRRPQDGRAAALQAAMQAVRSGKRADGSTIAGWAPDWAHPAAWAPFTLIASDD